MTPTMWLLSGGIASFLAVNTPWKTLLAVITGQKKPTVPDVESILLDVLKTKFPNLAPLAHQITTQLNATQLNPTPATPVTVDATVPAPLDVSKIIDAVVARLSPAETADPHELIHKLQDVIAGMYAAGDNATAEQLAQLLPAVSTTCAKPKTLIKQ